MITRKARLWVGATLLVILGINYALVGFPLYKKSESIVEAAKGIYLKQAKSNKILQGTRDEYLLDVFRREKNTVDRAFLILNCVSVTALVVILSWVIFGMFRKKKDEFAYHGDQKDHGKR